jgi:hypothetical protein
LQPFLKCPGSRLLATTILAAAVTFAHAQTTAPEDPAYPIVTQVPAKVGDRFMDEYAVSYDESSLTRWSNDPELLKDQSLESFRLTCITEVKAVNESGASLEEELTVRSATQRLDYEEIQLLRAGQKIRIDLRGEKARFVVDGEEIPEAFAEMLRSLVPADPPTHRDPDPVLGHDVKLKVGETYRADPAELAGFYRARDQDIPAESILRTVKLVAAEPVGGKLTLKVEMDQRISAYNAPIPEDRKADLKKLTLTQDGRSVYIVPLDTNDPTLDHRFAGTQWSISEGRTKDGAYRMETTMKVDWRMRRMRISAAAATTQPEGKSHAEP